MRYLNKIIFLNSANIRNAEIMLNGNVHFSGTQGVGKSTILRAILFFYNSDKTRLGISSSQKSFEEFYFPYANSYIIYEVATERGNYSILTSRTQGQIGFRFIDAAFDYTWLVNETREVETNWPKIHSNIGSGVFISNKITTYEQYRDIIFGNKQGKIRNLERFAIVESSKYQNIPRSIQNVFLNSKLDSEFIKTTLINSIDEADLAINLDNYRTWLDKFEKEFSEIDTWFKKDKSGYIPVRKRASEMISSLKDINACEFDIKQFWHQLNYAVEKSQERIPQIDLKIKQIDEEIKSLKKKEAEATNEYNKKHDQIKVKIGELKGFLDKCREKRKYYDQINIIAILENEGRKPQLENALKGFENQLSLIQVKFDDTSIRFKLKRDAVANERRGLELLLKNRIQEFNERKNKEIEDARENMQKEIHKLDNNFELWMKEYELRRENAYQDYIRAENNLRGLKYEEPLKKEKQNILDELTDIKEEKITLSSQIDKLETRISLSQKEVEYKLKEKESAYQNQMNILIDAMLKDKNELTLIEEKLKKFHDSLYNWLTINKHGWNMNIGKIIKEEILFESCLSPMLSQDPSQNLYGVDLKLDMLPFKLKTPDELKIQKGTLENSIKDKNLQYNSLLQEKDNFIANLNQNFKRKISELNKEKSELSYRLDKIPEEIKSHETRFRLLKEEEQNILKEEKKKREARKNEAWSIVRKEDSEKERKQIDIKRKKEKLEAELRSVKKKLQNEEVNLKVKINVEIKDINKDYEQKLEKIRQEETVELKNQGADTNVINQLNSKIKDIQKELKIISDNHDFVVKYNNDLTEYFEKEESKKLEKTELEEKDSNLAENFRKVKSKRIKTIEDKGEELRRLSSELTSLEEGLQRVREFIDLEKGVPEDIITDVEIKKTSSSCQELLSAIRGKFADKIKFFNDLKKHTYQFISNFSEDNIFSFKFPTLDEDYIPFALEIQDFIDNDKITEYKSRVSHLYKEVLSSLTRETSQLLNSSSQINSIILALNEDFRRKNFAGVIKKIELRSMESSDTIMQLLMSIQNFIIDNQLNIGEANLFSDEDQEKVIENVIDYLKRLRKELQKHQDKKTLSLSDTFRLQFRIQENDNDSGFKEHLSHIGSDGTDILVKAIVNILLINVFKEKAAKKKQDFVIHCMMDEIGKLHPGNVAGILQFANARNIYLINSSPMSYNADAYKHNYVLTKDAGSKTIVQRTITILGI